MKRIFALVVLLLAASATYSLASGGGHAVTENPVAVVGTSDCEVTAALESLLIFDQPAPAPEFRSRPPLGCDDFQCNIDCQPTFSGGSCVELGDDMYCLCWM